MNNRQEIPLTNGHGSLRNEGLRLIRGWDDRIASQLVENSIQPEILKWTPKDHKERFSSLEAANEWHERDPHVVYALARAAELAGVIWFTKKQTADVDANYTFAIRMYELARGRGLSGEFASATLGDFNETTNYQESVWLETDTNNTVALHLYEKLGFRDVLVSDGRIKMVRERGLGHVPRPHESVK